MTNLPGQSLGPYDIIEQIGQGGMAVVYRARQKSLARDVALKVLSPPVAAQPGFLVRFEREAKTAAALEHPHILPIYDFGQAQGYSYIAMRYIVEGRTLETAMQQRLDLARSLALLEPVAAALGYAHAQGVIHRDVKPSNILLAADWPLLADFGLVKLVDDSTKLTQTGYGPGTAAYMSPEQADAQAVDGRTDIYALGVILFEMLTGHLPHAAPTPVKILMKRLTEPPPSPRHYDAAISPALERVVLKALAPDPAERYGTTDDFIGALRAAVMATDVEATEPLLPSGDPTPSQPPPQRGRGEKNLSPSGDRRKDRGGERVPSAKLPASEIATGRDENLPPVGGRGETEAETSGDSTPSQPPPQRGRSQNLSPSESRGENLPPSGGRGENLPPSGNRGENFPPSGNRGENFPPSGNRGETLPPSGDRGETLPPSGDRGETLPPSGNRGKNLPPSGSRGKNLPPSGGRGGENDPSPPQVTYEITVDSKYQPTFTTILQKMFAAYARVVVKQSFTGDNFSGSWVVLVHLAERGETWTPPLPVVVKIASVSLIEKEWRAYERHIAGRWPYSAAIQAPPVVADSGELAGLVYDLAGEGVFGVESLRRFCRRAETTAADIGRIFGQVSRVLDSLLPPRRIEDQYGLWASYDPVLPVNLLVAAQPETPPPATKISSTDRPAATISPRTAVSLEQFVVTKVNPQDDTVSLNAERPADRLPDHSFFARLKFAEGQLPTYDIEQRIERISGQVIATRDSEWTTIMQQALPDQPFDRTQPTVTLAGLTLPNPFPAMARSLRRHRSVKVNLIHGDLNLGNILVIGGGPEIRLIDFAEARVDHVLHDFLRLETEIIVHLLAPLLAEQGLPLAMLRPFFEQLHCATFHSTVSSVSPTATPPSGLEKPFVALTAIRALARKHALFNPDEAAEYYEALTIYLLGAMKFGNLTREPGEARPWPKEVAFWSAAVVQAVLTEGVGCEEAVKVTESETPEPASAPEPTPSPPPANIGINIGGSVGGNVDRNIVAGGNVGKERDSATDNPARSGDSPQLTVGGDVGGDVSGNIVAGGDVVERREVFNVTTDRRDTPELRQRERLLNVTRQRVATLPPGASTYALELHPQAVESDPWGVPSPPSRADSQPLPPNTQVGDLFRRASDQRLLLLGEPEGGRRSIVAGVMQGALNRAAQDHAAPLPLLAPLAAWEQYVVQAGHGRSRAGGDSLAAWLVATLTGPDYDLTAARATDWLGQGELLLALSGLERVTPDRRATCLAALNGFIEAYQPRLVVTCRAAEYYALPARLKVRYAILVKAEV